MNENLSGGEENSTIKLHKIRKEYNELSYEKLQLENKLSKLKEKISRNHNLYNNI